MKNIILALTLGGALISCAGAVRYSPAEIQDYPPAIQEQVKAGEVSLGMTLSQVRHAWGGPSEVVVLKPTAEGKYREEWIYKGLFGFRTSLIFTEGKLTEIISTEPGITRTRKK
jgi:hypothetical protein